MTRHYQSGTAASAGDLLNIISYFMTTTVGTWTLEQENGAEKYNNSPTDFRNTKYFSINGGYFFLSTGHNPNDNYMIGGVLEGVADTDTGGSPYAFDDQQGYAYHFNSNEMPGPYTKYHLFGGNEGVDGNYIYCVLETSAGLFTHFGIGDVNRIGATTCRFATGLYWHMSVAYWRNIGDRHHQRMFDSHDSSSSATGHVSLHQNNPVGTAELYRLGVVYKAYGGSVGGWNAQFLADGPNALNGRTMLMPNHIVVYDTVAWYRLVGVAPAFRSLRIDNLQPEDIVDTDWMVFPVKAKNAPTGPTSANYGWAYKFQ